MRSEKYKLAWHVKKMCDAGGDKSELHNRFEVVSDCNRRTRQGPSDDDDEQTRLAPADSRVPHSRQNEIPRSLRHAGWSCQKEGRLINNTIQQESDSGRLGYITMIGGAV